MKKDDCIFCKLANGEFPTRKIYEDENFVVFMDLGPATKGHSLVVPKEHYANIYEMPADLLGEAMKVAQKVATKMTEALHADGFNILQNKRSCFGKRRSTNKRRELCFLQDAHYSCGNTLDCKLCCVCRNDKLDRPCNSSHRKTLRWTRYYKNDSAFNYVWCIVYDNLGYTLPFVYRGGNSDICNNRILRHYHIYRYYVCKEGCAS